MLFYAWSDQSEYYSIIDRYYIVLAYLEKLFDPHRKLYYAHSALFILLSTAPIFAKEPFAAHLGIFHNFIAQLFCLATKKVHDAIDSIYPAKPEISIEPAHRLDDKNLTVFQGYC